MSSSNSGFSKSRTKAKKKKKTPAEADFASTISEQSLETSHLVTALQTARKQERRLAIVNTRLGEELDEKENQLEDQKQEIHTLKYHTQYLQEVLHENSIPFTLEVNKTLLPGVSEEIAHQIRTENARLQLELNYSRSDFFDLQKVVEENRGLFDRLEDKSKSISELNDKISQLENSLQTSDNNKDKEIYRLEQVLKKHIQKETLQEIVCDSLYRESEEYKRSLTEAEEEIQKYKIATKDNGSSKVTDVKVSTPAPEVEKKEFLVLKGKFKEVVELNKKWQTYNNEQQAAMKTLKTRVQELESIVKTTATKGEPEQRKEAIEKLIQVNSNDLERVQRLRAHTENQLKKSAADLHEAKKRIESERSSREALEKENQKLKAAKANVMTEEAVRSSALAEMSNLRGKFKEAIEQNKKWQVYSNANENKMKDMQKRIQELEQELERKEAARQDSRQSPNIELAASVSELSVIRSKLKESNEQNVKWQIYNNDLQKKMKNCVSRIKELEAIIESSVETGQDEVRRLLELNKNEMRRVQEENEMFSSRMNDFNEILEKLQMTERRLSETEREKNQLMDGIRGELKQERRKNMDINQHLEKFRNENKQLQAEKRALSKHNQELQIKMSKFGPAHAEASIHPQLKSQYESRIAHLQSELETAEQRLKSMESSQTFTQSTGQGGLEKLKRELSAYKQYQMRGHLSLPQQQIPIYGRSASQSTLSPEDQMKSLTSPTFDPDSTSSSGVRVIPMEKCPFCNNNVKVTELEDHRKSCRNKVKK